MSLYHKRVYLRQKNSTISCLINNHEPEELNYINNNNNNKHHYYPESSISKLSSTNTILYHNEQLEPYNNTNTKSKHISNKRVAKLLSYLHRIGNNQVYMIFMSVLTIYTIFAIDIDKGFFNVNASTYFSVIHSIAITLFIIEIIILSLTKNEYFNKFYFWVDCFSTVTMFLELIWIENLMSGASNVTVALSFAKVTKASRLSKIGARSSKIMKLIRLVKLIKLFKKEEEKEEKVNDNVKEEEELLENKVGGEENYEENVEHHKDKDIRDENGNDSDSDSDKESGNDSNGESSNHKENETNQQEESQRRERNNEESEQNEISDSSSSLSSESKESKESEESFNEPRYTFNPVIQRKKESTEKEQNNLENVDFNEYNSINNNNGEEELSINAEEDGEGVRDSFVRREHNSNSKGDNKYRNNDNNERNNNNNERNNDHNEINNDHNYKNNNNEPHLTNNREPPLIHTYKNITNNNLQEHQEEILESKFTIPPNFINNNINSFGNNLSIPDIYQPSQMESHELISEEDKNNIEDIMKIFFTQNMNLFVEKGKEIEDIENSKCKKNKIEYKMSIEEESKLEKKKKKTRKMSSSKNNYEKKENKQLSLESVENNQLKITENKHTKHRRTHNNNNNKNNNNTINNLHLLKPELPFSTNDPHEHQPESNTKRTSRSSSRLSFMKRKEILEIAKNKELKEKFNRSYNVNMTINEIPFSNIVQKMEKELQSIPPLNRHNVDPVKQAEIQQKYNELIEKSKKENEPKKVLSSENLKVGEVLKEEIQKNIVIMVMGLIMILPIIAADTWFDSDPTLSATAHLFIKDIMEIPTQHGRDQLLESFIQTGLEMNTPLSYFFIPINETCCEFPRQFPEYANNTSVMDYSELRLSEQTIVIDNNITIIFSKKESSQINSYLNLGRSLFITILLIFCSILFMRDIENHALNPLEKMSSLINKISTNPFEALKEINKQKNYAPQSTESWSSHRLILVNPLNPDEEQLETNILSNVIIKITSLLTIGAGEIGSEIISKNIENIGKETLHPDSSNDTLNHMNSEKSLGQNLIGVYVYLELRGFEFMCDIFGEQIFRYMNRITEIVHLCCIEMGGIPIEYDGKGFLLLFKPNSMLQKMMLLERKSTRHMKSKKTVVHSHPQKHQHIHNNNNPSETSSESSEEFIDQSNEGSILCNLSLLAISAMNRIIVEINQLEESRKLYQCIVQKYTTNSNGNINVNGQNVNINEHVNNTFNEYDDVFVENYEPHLVNAAVHIGECIYGSLGSPYKLECKCIGFDIAYTRHLCHMLAQESYGVSNILSEDIYTLLSEHEFLIKKLNIRQLDHVNIKELRHKDYKENGDIHFMGLNKLLEIKAHKEITTKLYTSDFYGKLEMYNSNESQLINYGHNNTLSEFKLYKTFMLTDKHLSSHSHPSNQSLTNKQHLERSRSKESVPDNLRSLMSVDDMSEHCLIAYQQREKWLGFAEKDDPLLLLMKLESEYVVLKESRVNYEAEFYTAWNEALESYYSEELTDSLTEFKYLHTFNQPYYDGPSRVFINRIQNVNIEQLNERDLKYNNENKNSENNLNNSQLSLHNLKEGNEILSFGVHNVVWKL